jgi:acetolactate synthase-1/3 small subunit
MKKMKEQFTISIFTENKVGLLHRVTIIFTRRHINIESITASESEVAGIYRYTIVVNETRNNVEKVVKQLEKQIDVFRAFYHTTDEIIHQEIALYKLATSAIQNGLDLEKIIRDHHARILSLEQNYIVIEKTGHKADTKELFEALRPYNVLEFVRSGRVAMMKEVDNFSDTLHELEKSHQTE